MGLVARSLLLLAVLPHVPAACGLDAWGLGGVGAWAPFGLLPLAGSSLSGSPSASSVARSLAVGRQLPKTCHGCVQHEEQSMGA
jgi:hypothetical protein